MLLVWTSWMVPGIHSLGGTERLWMLDLKAENISAFEACIQSIQIGKWPWRMTICARIFPHAQKILDVFSFPGLAGHNSLETSYHHTLLRYSLTCRETHLSEAAVVCFLVRSFQGGQNVDLNEGPDTLVYLNLDKHRNRSTRVVLGEGEWIIISVLGKVSPITKEEGRFLRASIDVRRNILNFLDDDFFEEDEDEVYGRRLIVGERGGIAQGFKQLFQTLCKAASIT